MEASLKDKITGGLFGMAVGDALGQAVKGLKPETVRQCFTSMDDFKDVRPFIGKGVKQYRMKGLYGIPTQTALAVLDGTLANKGANPAAIGQILTKLSAGGPEPYFGVYRHTEGGFRKAVASILDRPSHLPADENFGGGSCLSLAVPLALYHRKPSDALIDQCFESCFLLTQNRWEVLGTGVWGALLALSLEWAGKKENPEDAVHEVLERAPERVERVGELLRKRVPAMDGAGSDPEGDILADTFRGLLSQKKLDWPSLCDWIADTGSKHLKTPVSNPAQGTVLTLVPLAFAAVLKCEAGFSDALVRAAGLGKEAGKLGALTGSLAGVLYGFTAIPQVLKSGLVNAKEIRIRAEALASGRPNKGSKDLYAMELALTQKECEEGKKYVLKKTKKIGARPVVSLPYLDEDLEETAIPKKEDMAQWRKFQKDKTRKKRDRRRHLGQEPDGE